MHVRGFTVGDGNFVRSPGQDADIFVANLVDHADGAPVSIGYGRYGPDQSLTETMAVDDVMIVLEGALTVTADGRAIEARSGAIVHMPKGQRVTIRAGSEGALTAFVTYPHWEVARG